MPFFKKKSQELKKTDEQFKKNIREANRLLNNLDADIADFNRKYQNLLMRGKQAQSISELEFKLRQMHIQAEQAQALVRECEIDHADCVKMVEEMTEMFESSIEDLG